MTSLQLVLFAAGGVFVAGVLIYNWMQERRIRRQIDEAFRKSDRSSDIQHNDRDAEQDRIEPRLPGAAPETPRAHVAPVGDDDGDYEPPLAIQNRIASDISTGDYAVATAPLS